jgi:hypothetical protein
MNYKKLAAAVILGAAMLAPFAATSAADSDYEGHVYVDNRADVGIWITAIGLTKNSTVHNVGAWCVRPKTFDKHGLSADIRNVRGEVAHGGCQAHPVILDTVLPFKKTEKVWKYTLTQNGAAYQFIGPAAP